MAAILKKKPVKGLPVKKNTTVSKPKVATANKAPLKKTAPPAKKVERNEWGIASNSDQARVLKLMIEGGTDKHEVITRADKMFEGELTSGGKPKPTSTIMNQLIRSLTARGFTIEASWRFVPPAEGLTPKPRASVAKKAVVVAPKKRMGKLPVKNGLSKGAVGAGATPKKSVGKLPIKRVKASS